MKSHWCLDEESTSLLSIDSEVKKRRRRDRFVYSKKWAEDEDQESQSQSQQGYAQYICDSLGSSPESFSLRGFTLSKSSEVKKNNKRSTLQYLRNDKVKPFRKYVVAGWKDNYYTSLLDWSHSYMICAGSQNQLNLYNLRIYDASEKVSTSQRMCVAVNGESLTSLKTSPVDSKVAMGYSNGSLKLYDYEKQAVIHTWHYHILRIAALEWENDIILSGSKDQHLRLLDPRTHRLLQTERQLEKSHVQEVCGIKKKQNYIASGGNDNKVYIYDLRKQTAIHSYSHNAAVKALTWLDEKHLATGGGTADKSIKTFSMLDSSIQTIDTGSQVCSLCWNSNTRELISCQGFSLNEIIVWSNKFVREFTFHGHSTRVLYCALSPDEQYLASGAGDQNLKIWKIFPHKGTRNQLSNEQLR